MQLPLEIEAIILDMLGVPDLTWKTVRRYKKRINEIRKQLYLLSDDFACQAASENKYSDAYLSYNFPMNLVKTMIITQQIRSVYPRVFGNIKAISVLDIGCGEGAALFGLYQVLHQSHKIYFFGFDTSNIMLKKNKKISYLFKKKHPSFKIRTSNYDATSGLLPKKAEYDIIVLANSLAEIITHDNIPIRYIERLSKNLTPGGLIIIIEPALKKFSRRLMHLRNEIFNKEKAHILLPCLHEFSCPLYDLRAQKEWCHQSIRWQPPEYMKILNQELNREIKTLKFSYLIISNKFHKHPGEDHFLVISQLLKEKGCKRCFLCTPGMRVELVRLNKHTTKYNRAFGNIQKGDIIVLSNHQIKRHDYWMITENTKIRIKHSTQS